MLAFKNNENKANYNNHFLGNFKSSNPMSTTVSSENAKCHLIVLRKLKILVSGIISIVIVVIVDVISFVVVVISIGYLVL
jgi:hypothetical protein